ncbi:hypothetical protein [Rugamonas sp. DEMB1]|uniref:hypothetical protein n=1 Tax=Rugamonas sp. DEMB1 TaxID=3039386 RepID=UPI0024489701|nr:hypothetical protein [Rugamonas sp. DEMB1]WGG52109.1 hypothetical protein QC826_08010 [Rugamonas sp. DEMB1]
MPKIHTLNSRGNFMLPSMRSHFSWSDDRTFREVQQFHDDCLGILKAKGVNYDDLRTALTPQTNKHEAAFLFDEKRCDPKRIPGVDAADALFKLLPPKTTHSILGGELIDDQDRFARVLLDEVAVIARDLNFEHPCFCYVLYVNNLSDKARAEIHEGLKDHPGYLGYVPCTYASLAKTFVSMHLVNLAIKHKNMVILGHEDDRPNNDNVNLHLHDYAALGLKIRSVQDMYFGAFLSYKPEHMLLGESDDDLEIALRAMSKEVVSLSDCNVLIEESKFQYLTSEKLGKLELAGVAGITKNELEEAIRSKLRSNYLYSLDWRDFPATEESASYHGSFFNILLEFSRRVGDPERVTVGLEYIPAIRLVRVITMT